MLLRCLSNRRRKCRQTLEQRPNRQSPLRQNLNRFKSAIATIYCQYFTYGSIHLTYSGANKCERAHTQESQNLVFILPIQSHAYLDKYFFF